MANPSRRLAKLRSASGLLAACALLAVAFAGCSGGPGSTAGNGFSIDGPDDAGTYTFTAEDAADNYTWDFGDYSGLHYGASVTHAYGFDNGVVTVTLTATRAGENVQRSSILTLGDGTNQLASFVLQAATNWTVPNQPVRFSAATSTDPDGDTLQFAWSCYRKGSPLKTNPHPHAGFTGGRDFATKPAGQVTVLGATGPLPTPDLVLEGDMCDAIATPSPFAPKATIEGRFTRAGVYSITLLATDGKTPSTSGSWDLYVTGDRPSAVFRTSMAGVLQGGANGTVQGNLGEPLNPYTQDTFDLNTTSFNLELNSYYTFVNLTYDAGPGAGTPAANTVTWELKRGSTLARGGDGLPDNGKVGPLGYGPYSLTVRLTQGAKVSYSVTVESHLMMEPRTQYEIGP